MNKLLIFLFLTFTVTVSIFGQVPNIETGVSKELAQWRAANYSDIKFDLVIRLEKTSPMLTKIEKSSQKIKGTAVISLFNNGDLIILDWRKLRGKEDLSKISNLRINERPAYFEEIGGHLILKEGVLKNKYNTIRFDFITPVETGGAAMRYIDETDNSEFLYCVPNAENDLFPSFNQPDLKARFQLTAVKPDSWKAEIITNSYGTTVQSFRLGESIYSFEETEPMSANLFAFAAGEFAEFDCTGEACLRPPTSNNADANGQEQAQPLRNSDVPMKFYVRRSQAGKFRKYESEVFRLNRKTAKSAKLDIILLPEILNIASDYDGIKFVPESAVFK